MFFLLFSRGDRHLFVKLWNPVLRTWLLEFKDEFIQMRQRYHSGTDSGNAPRAGKMTDCNGVFATVPRVAVSPPIIRSRLRLIDHHGGTETRG
ncbi:MAG: hypothetical protein DMG67_13280 [Acidobacteria bacterium]|nr:MAG: hypothetical protein DMG67_13280 [Acidobacteriota bacterium]